MNRNFKAVLALAFSLTASQVAFADLLSDAKKMMGGDSVTTGLSTGLGLDAEQTGAGLGSIMSLAQNKLPAADYDSLAKLLPNTSGYIKMAQDAGVLTDPITDVGRLNSAMQKLGIAPDVSSSLYSKLGDLVGASGNESLQNSLAEMLK